MDTAVLVALAGGVGAIAGALITALITLLSSWLGRRHEHRRWLMDKRLEAYVAFNSTLRTWHRRVVEVNSVGEQRAVEEELAHRHTHIELLSPSDTVGQADEVMKNIAVVFLSMQREDADRNRAINSAESRVDASHSKLMGLQRRDIQSRPVSRMRTLTARLRRRPIAHGGR